MLLTGTYLRMDVCGQDTRVCLTAAVLIKRSLQQEIHCCSDMLIWYGWSKGLQRKGCSWEQVGWGGILSVEVE